METLREIVLKQRLPTIEEYRSLCESVGWGEMINFAAAEEGLPRSSTAVVAENPQGTAVGMGRIVGDEAVYFYIQDIVVRPAYQGQGIGTRILTALFDYLRAQAPPQAFIGLFSVPEAVDFYRNFTLEQRDLIGIFTVRELIA